MKRLVITIVALGLGCGGGGGGTQPTPQPPSIISGPSVHNITATSAEIRWKTDKICDSKVRFGRSGYEDSIYSAQMVEDHRLAISGLLALTTYHYNVTSKDAGGLSVTSEDGVFKTLSPAGDLVEDGWDFFESGSYDSALVYFGMALSYEPENLEALKGKGWAKLKLYAFDEARNTFETALGLSSCIDCLAGLVFCYLGLEAYDDVLEKSETLLELAGGAYVFEHDTSITAKGIRYARVLAFVAQGDFMAALDEVKILDPTVSLNPDDPSTWNGHLTFEEALLAIIEAMGSELRSCL